MKYFLFSLLLFAGVLTHAQSHRDHFLPYGSSGKGNYLYVAPAEMLEHPELLAQTTGFLIERVNWDTKGTSRDTTFRKIGEARPVASEKELRKYFSEPEIAELMRAFKLATPAELVQYFQTKRSPEDYSLYYTLLSVRLAMGHVYLDEKVEEGQVVFYRISRMQADNTRTPVGKILMVSKAGNHYLPYYKAVNTEKVAQDTLAFFTWKMPVGTQVLSRIPKPQSPVQGDREGTAVSLPDNGTGIYATAYTIDSTGLKEVAKLMPVLNASRDTATYSFTAHCRPDAGMRAFISMQDELGNQGSRSDTVTVFGVSEATVPLIYGIKVAELTGAIRLSWKALPVRPYINGILVARTDSKSHTDTLAMLPAADTEYLDYKIEPGNQYDYKVSVVFQPDLGIVQKLPAIGTGAYTKFELPGTPENLRAEHAGRNIRITWDSVRTKGLYGYYIYRGTTINNHSLIAGPIKTNSFVDTSGALSGKTEYYYRVMSQNLRQDTSDFSDVVKIRPNRAVTTTHPSTMEFHYEGRKLMISWNDIRQWNSAVAGYVLQREIAGGRYVAVVRELIPDNYYWDSGLVKAVPNRYRVAAVSVTGDTSAFSEPGLYTLPADPVDVVGDFFVRNTSDGVVISWPEATFDTRKAYNIYRRLSEEKSFTRIGTTTADQFSFTDKGVEPDRSYVYSISITAPDDREGDKSPGKSIKRKPVKLVTTF